MLASKQGTRNIVVHRLAFVRENVPARRAEIPMPAFLCHRLPDRSFLWLWDPPLLCARCTGLYAAIFVGAAVLLLLGERGKIPARYAFPAAGLSIVVIALEKWLGLEPGNGIRCLTALPLGFVLGQGLALPLHTLLRSNKKESL